MIIISIRVEQQLNNLQMQLTKCLEMIVFILPKRVAVVCDLDCDLFRLLQSEGHFFPGNH